MLATVLASLFFTAPAPLEMPRAEAYFVTQGAVSRLEDRFDAVDLWTARTAVGRWMDDDGRVFTYFRLAAKTPAHDSGETVTRKEARSRETAIDRRDEPARVAAISRLSPLAPTDEGEAIGSLPHGCRNVLYYHGTNTEAIVCAFLTDKESRSRKPVWRLVTWELADGDDFDERLDTFEKQFLGKREWEAIDEAVAENTPEVQSKAGAAARGVRGGAVGAERELLREDLRHSVAAYANWHFTDSEEFVILDDLKSGRGFVEAFTNDFPALRRRYAEVMPGLLDATNVLCVARIYNNRDDYLDAAGEDMQWSAAYWCQSRRELVACLPPDGDTVELRRTMRHEAFHQYLSYAASMIPASPWLNEGYAQYFEDEASTDFGLEVPAEKWDELAAAIPPLMILDYAEFYAGSDAERRAKYRLAWSIAYFLENGADKVRHRPFANVKRDYLAALLKTRDMRKATLAAFGSVDSMRLFANEWKKFWMQLSSS